MILKIKNKPCFDLIILSIEEEQVDRVNKW